LICAHRPLCPSATDPDRDAARVVATYPQQGWSLLCNGVVIFDDTGELLPDGSPVAPHRPAVCRSAATGHRAGHELRSLIARFSAASGSAGIFGPTRCSQRPGGSRA
jgi:hypothetical protein